MCEWASSKEVNKYPQSGYSDIEKRKCKEQTFMRKSRWGAMVGSAQMVTFNAGVRWGVARESLFEKAFTE